MNTFQNGERVIIIDGPFVGIEGHISKEIVTLSLSEANDLIQVTVNILERNIPVVLECWQITRK